MFHNEAIYNRANEIALRMRDKYPMDSPEWREWTRHTTRYNATSLTQVMAEYFATCSVGDIGTEDYKPLAGYPGTWAPGENLDEYLPFDDLPHKLTLPWIALQEIPSHCRVPVSHPRTPPVHLWLALNNMYTQVVAVDMNEYE